MIVVTIFSLVIAAYTLWQGYPARVERLGRNAAIGMRSAATMKSDRAWNAGHRAAWPSIRHGAVVLAVGSVISVLVPLLDATNAETWWAGIVLVSYLGYLGFLIVGFNRANRAARDTERLGSDPHESVGPPK